MVPLADLFPIPHLIAVSASRNRKSVERRVWAIDVILRRRLAGFISNFLINFFSNKFYQG